MLVLSRKVGQQVILPDCGVTIDVVAVAGKRVRLGIAAPSGTRVHRTEIWRRICQPDGSGPEEDGNGHGGDGRGRDAEAPGRPAPVGAHSARPPGDGRLAPCPARPPDPSPAPRDLDASLARWIVRRTGGRIRALSVQTRDGRLLVHGSAGSYYARQLAQAAVAEMLGALGRDPGGNVEFDIAVDG